MNSTPSIQTSAPVSAPGPAWPRLLVIGVIAALALGAFFVFAKHEKSQDAVPATSSWQTYQDEEHGIRFQYPPDWTVGVDPVEADGETFIRLTNPEGQATWTEHEAEGFVCTDCVYNELLIIINRSGPPAPKDATRVHLGPNNYVWQLYNDACGGYTCAKLMTTANGFHFEILTLIETNKLTDLSKDAQSILNSIVFTPSPTPRFTSEKLLETVMRHRTNLLKLPGVAQVGYGYDIIIVLMSDDREEYRRNIPTSLEGIPVRIEKNVQIEL